MSRQLTTFEKTNKKDVDDALIESDIEDDEEELKDQVNDAPAIGLFKHKSTLTKSKTFVEPVRN